MAWFIALVQSLDIKEEELTQKFSAHCSRCLTQTITECSNLTLNLGEGGAVTALS